MVSKEKGDMRDARNEGMWGDRFLIMIEIMKPIAWILEPIPAESHL